MLTDDGSNEPHTFQRAKEDDKSAHHHKETHGMRKDIDENTPLSDVKAPNVFERAKEEIEALVQTIHLKKESPTREKRYCVRPLILQKTKLLSIRTPL